jgi:hypothetical protein
LAAGAVSPIFSNRGRAIALAAELRCSPQTVYSWKYSNAIPRYRRREVLDAVHRMRLQLPVETILYLSKVF